jgi:hypothetical protein
VRAECLRYGRSLDDLGPTFTWADLIAICEATQPGDPLYMAMFPDDGHWTHDSMLMATIADALHIIAWQNGGGRKQDKPKPIPRPGVTEKQKKTYGSEATEIVDMQAWLDQKRRGA